jgi:hypothetical protein
MSNILAKTSSAQRQDCISCKDSIAVFALYSCYHKALCGTCVSKLRNFFGRKHCYTCGRFERRVIFTWRPNSEYEDFGNINGVDDPAYDSESGIAYEDFGMRNRGRKALRDAKGRVNSDFEQIEKRNAVCAIFVRDKHTGTGLLVKIKGHLCILTSNYILPDIEKSENATVKFSVHGAPSQTAAERTEVSHGNCFVHNTDYQVEVKLDPKCYFVTNIILDFSAVAIAGRNPFNPEHVKPIPLPKPWDPEAERLKKEQIEKQEARAKGKKAEQSKKVNGEGKRIIKRNFVIVKKRKGGEEIADEIEEKPSSRDGIIICGYPVGMLDDGKHEEKYEGKQLEMSQVRLRTDVAFMERTENQFLQYTSDVGPGWQGSPIFFNMNLVALHSHPTIKDNSDEAILLPRIIHFLNSVRSEALLGLTSGMLARSDNEEVQEIGCQCIGKLLKLENGIHISQLVRCNCVNALVAATKRWAISKQVLIHALPAMITLCQEQVYRSWIGQVDGVGAFLAVIRAQMGEKQLIEWGWECLALLMTVTSNQHEFAFQDGCSAAITMIRLFVSSEHLNKHAMLCVERVASHPKYHAELIKMNVVPCVLLSTSAHQDSVEIQVSGCLVVAHLLLSGYPLPNDNSMQLKPLLDSAKPPKLEKKRGSRAHQRRGRGPTKLAHEKVKLVIPIGKNGKRDRQLMKRDLKPTLLTTACNELGAAVNAQPRIQVMRASGGLDVLFMALKSFPKELHVVEPVWLALSAVAKETRADILLRTGHIRVMERCLKKCKKHPLIKEWTKVYDLLIERNSRN